MNTKPFYQSRTYWGLFVTLFSVLVQMLQPFDATIPAFVIDFINNSFVDLATQVGEFVGLAIAAWGRNNARTIITATP